MSPSACVGPFQQDTEIATNGARVDTKESGNPHAYTMVNTKCANQVCDFPLPVHRTQLLQPIVVPSSPGTFADSGIVHRIPLMIVLEDRDSLSVRCITIHLPTNREIPVGKLQSSHSTCMPSVQIAYADSRMSGSLSHTGRNASTTTVIHQRALPPT